jgi:DNA-binding NtrC family response regulator
MRRPQSPALQVLQGVLLRHILVIDDDALFCDSLATTLRRAGYAVTARNDARDLDMLLAAESFYAIVTDLYMPECDGIEVLLRVRAASRGTRLIGISGAGLDMDSVCFRAMKALGAVGVLEKPLDRGALLALLAPPAAAA